MTRIVTLTMNPAIDGSCEADRVFPTHKIRTNNEKYDPGGGGINVARVIARLGGDVLACYLGGGATGAVLDSLLDDRGLPRLRIHIADHTRSSLAVHERATGQEYRFVPEGPLVSEAEWRAAFDRIAETEFDYLVASGSLPRGVPDDFYAQLSRLAVSRGAKFVLDTSGEPLARAVEAGNIFMLKPSKGEFERLVGRPLADVDAIAGAAAAIVAAERVEHIVVSMGHLGALLADRAGARMLPAVPVEAKSAVGAGDSFVGAMTLALAIGRTADEAFRYGLAAGTAAVLCPGTDLCCSEDVDRMLDRVGQPQPLDGLPDMANA